MSKEMICPFCGEELEPVYRQAGVRVEIAYHLCKKCNKRAEIEIWQALIQSQRDLQIAVGTLRSIGACNNRVSNLALQKMAHNALAQITHDNSGKPNSQEHIADVSKMIEHKDGNNGQD